MFGYYDMILSDIHVDLIQEDEALTFFRPFGNRWHPIYLGM